MSSNVSPLVSLSLNSIVLDAQDRVSEFYEKNGYTKTDIITYEDDVKHVQMVKNK